MKTIVSLGLLRAHVFPWITRQRAPIPTRMLSSMSPGNSHNVHLLVNTIEADLDWSDRIGLQGKWENSQKGWQVEVEWRQTPYGAGLFALEDIPEGTVLRTGKLGVNLYHFESVDDIYEFCQQSSEQDEYQARLLYVKDYLWGFNRYHADERGYIVANANNEVPEESWFFGMWIPGNGLNHSLNPNTVYKWTGDGIDLVALQDIATNDELYDDYRRHGNAPEWLQAFAKKHQVSLNFADCNDFVGDPGK